MRVSVGLVPASAIRWVEVVGPAVQVPLFDVIPGESGRLAVQGDGTGDVAGHLEQVGADGPFALVGQRGMVQVVALVAEVHDAKTDQGSDEDNAEHELRASGHMYLRTPVHTHMSGVLATPQNL